MKNKDTVNKFERLQYPSTKDGYAESVNPADDKEILHRLDKFGLVVVPLLSTDEQSRLLDSFFHESNKQQRPGATHKLSLDPLTHGNQNWPAKSHFLVKRRPTIAFEPTLTRTHPLVHKVFTTIFGTDKLVSSIDRFGIMRGTVDVPTQQADGSVRLENQPQWRQNLVLHWDMNPWSVEDANGNLIYKQRYQALISVLDSPVNGGGFRAVVGSHKYYMQQWADKNKMPEDYSIKTYQQVKISSEDPAQKMSQNLPVKAGDMLVFDSRLLHGTFQNNSPKMRLVQYVRMMPQSMAKGDVFSAVNVLERHPDWRKVLKSYDLDERAQRLLSLQDYNI